MQKGFVIDLNKCTGCQACQLACTIENQLDLTANWRRVFTFNQENYPGIPQFYLSLACNHCLEPACLKYCPALAYTKDQLSGAVLIDSDACIGCKYCSWVCPFDAPRMNHSAGTMEKCTLCNPRLQEGLQPACVTLCPTSALQIEDLGEDDPSVKVEGFPSSKLKPAIRFIPLAPGRQTPELSIEPPYDSLREILETDLGNTRAKTDLKSEWSLIVFTIITAFLVGTVFAERLAAFRLNPFIFVGFTIVALGSSLIHLGKKLRAYRVILNVKNSWLSREILFFSLFLISAFVLLVFAPGANSWWWVTTFLGLSALWSVDKIYQIIPGVSEHTFHSAQVLWSGFFFAGILAGNFLVAALFGGMKILLYLRRKIRCYINNEGNRPILTAARLVLGFLIPLILGVISFQGFYYLIIACVLLGESIDRVEFYLELDILTPARQMEIDLKKWLG